MDEKKDYPIDRFLRDVAQAVARDDRGYLAELRRGLGGTTQDQAWEHLIPYCSDFDTDAAHRAVWCAVGGLAALLAPDGLVSNEPWNNLGTTMRTIAKGGEGDEAKALKSFEPKFRRLLSCGDTVSLPEEALLRFTSRRVFRHKRSGGKHVLAQFSVPPMGSAQYADAGAACKQAAPGRGAVDPLGET